MTIWIWGAVLSKNEDWIRIFNIEEFKELSERMERIIYNNENGFTATMFWTIEQSLAFVYHYHNSRGDFPDDESWNYVEDFVEAFVAFLESYLEEEGIDYRDERP
jgi:hypothetical protein